MVDIFIIEVDKLNKILDKFISKVDIFLEMVDIYVVKVDNHHYIPLFF